MSESDEDCYESKLLKKFPSFDPSWPDETKIKWFEAYSELLKTLSSDDPRGAETEAVPH